MLIRQGAAPAPAPDTPADSAAPMAHVTCLDCGREFWYDWAHMRRLGACPQTVYPSPLPSRSPGGRRAA